jgi:hypothetical protein
VVTAVFSLEAGTGILLGQSDGLMLLAATLAIEALHRGRPVIAGLLLVPLLLKPQLVWLVPPVLIVARQWRMLCPLAAGAVVVLLGSIAVAGPGHLLDAIGLVTAPAYAHLDLQSNSIPALIARPLASNPAAWVAALSLAVLAVVTMVVLRDVFRRNVVPALAIGLGLSVVLSPHLGDYSLMLLAIPVATLAPRAPALALVLAAAYTAASLFNPLNPLNESTVALVLLVGLHTRRVGWRCDAAAPAISRGCWQCLTSARCSEAAWPAPSTASRMSRPISARRWRVPPRRRCRSRHRKQWAARGLSPPPWNRSPLRSWRAPRHSAPRCRCSPPSLHRSNTIVRGCILQCSDRASWASL